MIRRSTAALALVGAVTLAGCATPVVPAANPTPVPAPPQRDQKAQPVAALPRPAKVDPRARVWPPRGGDVALVGDSLTVGAAPYLQEAFDEVGSEVEVVKAVVGIPVATGLYALQAARVGLPDTVVVALGTNNLTATPQDVVDWLEQARLIIGPQRRLVWVNLAIANERYANDEVVNAVLAQSANRDPRLLVLDWAGYARDNHIANVPDGVHYDDPGYQARAGFYACAVVRSATCEGYQLHGLGN